MSAEGNAYDTAKLETFFSKTINLKEKHKIRPIRPTRSIRSHRDFGVVIAVWERVTNK